MSGREVGRVAHVGDHGARGRVIPLGRGEEVALDNNLDLCSLHQEPVGRVGLEPGGRDCVVVPRRKGVFRIGTDDAAHLAQFLEEKRDKGKSEARATASDLPGRCLG